MITNPPPISFTTLSEKNNKKKIKKNYMLHVRCDTWHVTRDTWRDTWHMTCDMFGGVNILSKFQLPSSYSLWFMMLWISGGKGSVTQSVNHEAVYRTDPATPGLLKIVLCNHSFSFRQLLVPIDYKILAFLTEVKKGFLNFAII